jgi:hypothetical protein
MERGMAVTSGFDLPDGTSGIFLAADLARRANQSIVASAEVRWLANSSTSAA